MDKLAHPGPRSSLASRLRWAMKRKGLNQNELASLAGIKQPSIAQLLSGRSKRSSYIAEIGLALDVSTYWLATGKGQPSNSLHISWEARQVAKRYDSLPPEVQADVVAYMDYLAARLTDPLYRDLDPLESVISRAFDHPEID